MSTCNESYKRLFERHVEVSIELLEVKLKLRDMLAYPEGEPSVLTMVHMLGDKIIKLNELIERID